MRYKFRGKPFNDVDFDEINVHISKNDFVYGNLIQDGNKAFIVNGIVEVNDDYIQLEQWIKVRPETIGQSTNLFDKNGKEIFEGDVVKANCYYFYDLPTDNNPYQSWRTTEIVKYVNGHLNCKIDTFTIKNYSMEIIGTIHDNHD